MLHHKIIILSILIYNIKILNIIYYYNISFVIIYNFKIYNNCYIKFDILL